MFLIIKDQGKWIVENCLCFFKSHTMLLEVDSCLSFIPFKLHTQSVIFYIFIPCFCSLSCLYCNYVKASEVKLSSIRHPLTPSPHALRLPGTNPHRPCLRCCPGIAPGVRP